VIPERIIFVSRGITETEVNNKHLFTCGVFGDDVIDLKFVASEGEVAGTE